MKREIRKMFPALEQKINGNDLVYLDSAATALKPIKMIESLTHFYNYETANIHRGAHTLSARATDKYECTREKVRVFLNAKNLDEIIFTKGTTESINLVAAGLGEIYFKPGDEIVLSEMEHHSNIVPWQALAEKKGLTIKWIPVLENGELDEQAAQKLIGNQTKLVAITHCSNTLGTVNPIKKIINWIRKNSSAQVLVDAAQSVTFTKIDVQDLDCDYLAFSAHKLYGPYGVGVLFIKKTRAQELPPYQYGGAMIVEVSKDKSTYLPAPQKFEAGTPNVSGVIALSAAIEFVEELGLSELARHEQRLCSISAEGLKSIPGLRFIGQSSTKTNLHSFIIDQLHSSDIGTLLDQQGVAVRTGHHCTMPLLTKMKLTGTVRASFAVYNNEEDVEKFILSLKKSVELLK